MRKTIYSLCYLAGAAVGIMLCIFNYMTLKPDHPILTYLMIATGIIFIIPGIAQLISSLHPKRDTSGNIVERRWYSTIIAVLALLWGISILCMPDGFVGNLSITIGVSVILAGIAQIVWIVRSAGSTFLRFIIPLLTIAAGITAITIFNHYPDHGHSAQTACILCGITLVVWAGNGFMALRPKRAESPTGNSEKEKTEKEKKESEKPEKEEKEKKKTEKPAKTEKEAKAVAQSEKKS